MSLTAIVWSHCGVLFDFPVDFIKVKDEASEFSNYAIAGGTLPLYLILFTDIATIMGAELYRSCCSSTDGLLDIPFVFGERVKNNVCSYFAGLPENSPTIHYLK